MRRTLLILVLLAGSPPCLAEATLFDDLGGRDKISAFTSDLVVRLRKDQRISGFFTETDMERFHDRLTDFFCHLSGENRPYRGANLYYAHKGLGIRERDFDALAEDLEESMEASSVPYSAQTRLLALLVPLKRMIVND